MTAKEKSKQFTKFADKLVKNINTSNDDLFEQFMNDYLLVHKLIGTADDHEEMMAAFILRYS